jgi:hypothetical protein
MILCDFGPGFMPEQIVCVRDTKVTIFSGFVTIVEKLEWCG